MIKRRLPGKPDPSDCRNIKDMFAEYFAGELSEIQKKHVETHIKECAQCREEFERLSNAIRFLKNNDPATGTATSLSAKRRRKVLWLMGHPFLAFCAVHHRLFSFLLSVFFVLIVIIFMFLFKFYQRPTKAMAPVEMISAEECGALPPPELEPVPQNETWENGF